MKEKKLKILFDSLSWTEKVGQLIQLSGDFFSSEALAVGPQTKLGISDDMLKNVGSVLNITGAKETKYVQMQYMKKARHQIPLLFMADIIYGYRTIFPIPLGQGATWNPNLIRKAYEVVGEESRFAGAHVTFAPMVDLVRDARWGRCLESTGEDNYLVSQFAEATVKGLQHNIEKGLGIAACTKHFAAYGAVESGRDYNTVDMSERKLRQDYLPGYKAAVDAGSKLVMTSFNTYDGVPATGSQFLLREVLRDEWGFNGVVISDYAAIRELIDHGLAKDNREATILAIKAGTDIDMKSPCYANELEPLILNGKLDESLINEAVWRVLVLKNDLGLFEDPFRGADPAKEKDSFVTPKKRELARKVASESIVLLKNNRDLLPLTANKEKVLLVGPYGDNTDLIGLWAMQSDEKDVVTIKRGFENYLNENVFSYAKGCDMLESYEFLGEFGGRKISDNTILTSEEEVLLLEDALKLGNEADVIVFAMGEHVLQSGEAASRTDIRLPKIQRTFIDKLSKLGKKNILISFSGRPLVLTEEEKKFDAILHAWFPGIEGGNAIAQIIFGDINPSGRLNISFPHNVGQVPMSYNEFNTGRPLDSKTHIGRFVSKYLDSPNAPLYPFGFGLSYAKVVYKDLKLSTTKMKSSIQVNVKLKNLSTKDSLETVQLYVRDMVGSVVRPIKELKKFKKIVVSANSEIDVEFTLSSEELKFYTKDMKFKTEKGDFTIFVGPNSQQTLSTQFELV
ncbi:beta-glucosidase BglX [Carnobacterium maltaromaticum]|uniref:beta-glucosidase BglX n=1 Tax=Lactobacillales TaxID=186826 RepID=UPI000704C3D9|nr:beta-glucosidase BglX [Carnobacterium maltaromaticum]KRN86371.1 Beta-glucosidase-related glycosidase [Carnobacterium maltaromaticum]MDT1945294.1 beta-glucosidase BglX [Carnobacterium maltaromaticum]MDT1999665.1 beta-glucosidase BglX [Carnobacterium maltaromaticum]TFJ32286.1 beta-glucosidase BglX [Carnobacterium maltaromaticum]TFJ35637.1 beta-glucosidase BglX [Carnobacterium maltaromaticum]